MANNQLFGGEAGHDPEFGLMRPMCYQLHYLAIYLPTKSELNQRIWNYMHDSKSFPCRNSSKNWLDALQLVVIFLKRQKD